MQVGMGEGRARRDWQAARAGCVGNERRGVDGDAPALRGNQSKGAEMNTSDPKQNEKPADALRPMYRAWRDRARANGQGVV